MRKLVFSALFLLAITSNGYGQNYIMNNGRKVFPSPDFSNQSNILFARNETVLNGIANLATSSPALPLAENGLKKMEGNKFPEAQEAFRTALRLEPMNMGLWQLYDDSVIADYITNRRDEILKSVTESDLAPTFAITKVDSYIELDTLYIVGTVKNLTKKSKQKINLRARLLDQNKRELRSEQGTLRSIDKVLYPNESSLFEIPFKNPPFKMKSFRVEVSSWE